MSFSQVPTTVPKPRVHLAFLDGLRGLAALFVVLFHVVVLGQERPEAGTVFVNWLRYGHEAVVVFIALSGYCLMLPVAGSTSGLQLRGGVREFIKRRARRILPPYYVALVLWPVFLFLVQVFKHVAHPGSADFGSLREMLGDGRLTSHLLLVHNLRPDWNTAIAPALWSIATEWQIYIVFALLLLPVWRRWGAGAALAAGIVLGIVPIYLLPPGHNFAWACPWMLGVFAMGMLAAVYTTPGPEGAPDTISSGTAAGGGRSLWGWLTVSFLAAFCLVATLMPELRLSHHRWIPDTIIGASSVCLIAFCAVHVRRNEAARAPLILRLLQSRWAVSLGTFSYSLYLTHLPTWAILGTVLNLDPIKARFPWLTLEPLLIRVFVLIPFLLLFAYGFYLLIERRFSITSPSAAATCQKPVPAVNSGGGEPSATAPARPAAS